MRIDQDFQPIVTERLRIRRSRPADAEAISRYRSDPDVHRHQGWERTDPDSVRRDILEMAGRAPGEPGGWVQFTVERREDGLLVGDVGMIVAEEPGVVKIGYTIDPAHHRRGYATEAVAALVDHVFRVLGADVVRAYADAENAPSIRVAEKVGMRLVERIRHVDREGVWYGVRYERRRDDVASS